MGQEPGKKRVFSLPDLFLYREGAKVPDRRIQSWARTDLPVCCWQCSLPSWEQGISLLKNAHPVKDGKGHKRMTNGKDLGPLLRHNKAHRSPRHRSQRGPASKY